MSEGSASTSSSFIIASPVGQVALERLTDRARLLSHIFAHGRDPRRLARKIKPRSVIVAE
ncbi:hypothetical protein ACFSHP_19340 [Novosphingobium panipatense]